MCDGQINVHNSRKKKIVRDFTCVRNDRQIQNGETVCLYRSFVIEIIEIEILNLNEMFIDWKFFLKHLLIFD